MPALKKVLVVEDDPELSSLMERALKSENYEVATVWSGDKALIEAKRRVFSFPISEYWLDVGHHGDYAQANADVEEGVR